MKEIILAYQGEMTLKGLNRSKFEARLAKSIRYRLEDLGKFKVTQAQSTVFIEPREDDLDMDEAFRRISKIFGIVKMSRAACCSKDFDEICATAEAYLGETLRGIRTFKVEAKRADKTFPMKSPELCRELGAYLLGKHPHLRVNVHEPQLEIMVEIRDKGAYIHGPKVEAAGGLPVGTSGRALNLLSGGIDSPVAAYCMARRGLALHHIHFASPPYTSLRAKLKVRALARELAEYTGNCQLFVVPYTKPQEYIRDNAPDVLFTVLMRRSMLRIAKLVADQSEMEALITGESLAQVASQTMQAIACTDAAQNLPILRPLIGMDKTEIIAISRKIGTFDTSIEPYEDCCTIFTPPHPKTKPSLAEIEAAEAGMPGLAELERIAAETDAAVQVVQVGGGKTAAVQLNHGAQIGGQHGQHVHDHPLGAVAGNAECLNDLQTLQDADLLLAGGLFHLSGQLSAQLIQIDLLQQLLDGLSTHGCLKLIAVALTHLAVFLLGQQLLFFQRGQTGIGNDIACKVQDLLQQAGADVQHQANAAGDALEVPDVADGRGQLNVAHALTANLCLGDLDTAAIADLALVADALVLAAVALPVLGRSKNALAVQAVALRLQGAVVDGLRLLDLAVAPVADLLRRSQADFNGIENVVFHETNPFLISS